jgi:hypothetical protein
MCPETKGPNFTLAYRPSRQSASFCLATSFGAAETSETTVSNLMKIIILCILILSDPIDSGLMVNKILIDVRQILRQILVIQD